MENEQTHISEQKKSIFIEKQFFLKILQDKK